MHAIRFRQVVLRKRKAESTSVVVYGEQYHKVGLSVWKSFSPASDEGETVDVLGFVVFSLSETFFSGKEVVDFGLRLVVRGLCTPFAVLRTSAGLGINDRTHVEFV